MIIKELLYEYITSPCPGNDILINSFMVTKCNNDDYIFINGIELIIKLSIYNDWLISNRDIKIKKLLNDN